MATRPAGSVHLSGQLICATPGQAAIVAQYLPTHIALTRQEPGCLSFEVVPSRDPLRWHVDELFVDEAAFALHQERASRSEWGIRTRGITREFTIEVTP